MMHLSVLDLAIITVYMLGVVLLGTGFARRQRDTRAYFVGGRNIGGWLVLISVVATETSTVTFLSVPGLAFNPGGGNLTFLQLALGYIAGRCIVAWLLLPQYFQGEFLTAYQLLRKRFDSRVQRTASGIFLVTRTAADGLRLFLTALLLNQFTGWNLSVSILVMGTATIIYTYFGGMEAVIWTDVIQFGVYIAGAILAGALILRAVPGGWTELLVVGSAAGKFELFDFSLDLSKTFTLWAGLIGGAFFTMASHGADQLMVQRFLCARSLRTARIALVSSGVVVFAQFALFLFIGIGLYALWVREVLVIPEELMAEMNDRRSYDAVFGHYIVNYLPVGLMGLLVAAVMSAAMSTLSSSLNSSSGALVNDFYRPLRPDRSEAHYLGISRLLTAVWGLAQIGVALLAVAALRQNVIGAVLSIAGLTTGLILGLFTLGSLPRPVRSGAALIGLIGGLGGVLGLWLPSQFGLPLLAWPWFAPVGTALTVSIALLADRMLRLGTSIA